MADETHREPDMPDWLGRRVNKLRELADLLRDVSKLDPRASRRLSAQRFEPYVRLLGEPRMSWLWRHLPPGFCVSEVGPPEDYELYHNVICDIAVELELPDPEDWPHLLLGVFQNPEAEHLYLLQLGSGLSPEQARLWGVQLPSDWDAIAGIYEAPLLVVEVRLESGGGVEEPTSVWKTDVQMLSGRLSQSERYKPLRAAILPMVRTVLSHRQVDGREIRVRVWLDQQRQRVQRAEEGPNRDALSDAALALVVRGSWTGLYWDIELDAEMISALSAARRGRQRATTALAACLVRVLVEQFTFPGKLEHLSPATGRPLASREHVKWWAKRLFERKTDEQIADELGQERPTPLFPEAIKKERQRRRQSTSRTKPSAE